MSKHTSARKAKHVQTAQFSKHAFLFVLGLCLLLSVLFYVVYVHLLSEDGLAFSFFLHWMQSN